MPHPTPPHPTPPHATPPHATTPRPEPAPPAVHPHAGAPCWAPSDDRARAEATGAFHDGYHTAVRARVAEHCRLATPDDVSAAVPRRQAPRTAVRTGALGPR